VLFRWLSVFGSRTPPPEVSQFVIGSTGSGKSEGALQDLVRLANEGQVAIVLLDPHGPLAQRTVEHWLADGHAARVIYEPLDAVDRTLNWSMLQRSAAASERQRRLEDQEIRDELVMCFISQRHWNSLADKPWTREWLEAALELALAQPDDVQLYQLPSAFHIGSSVYQQLMQQSDRADVVAKFAQAERLFRRSPMTYEAQTGAARRLLETLCRNEVLRLRGRPGPLVWDEQLRQRSLLAFDGGGLRSRDIKRTLFLLVSSQVVQAIRRHMATEQTPLPVVLMLEEAGATDLIAPFILDALAELRKAGLSITIISQSSADFSEETRQSLLANTPRVVWYQVLSPLDQALGATILINTSFDAKAVHYTRSRLMNRFRPKSSHLVTDTFYKTPQVQEQEARTRLATLRVGERFVRDRSSARFERLTLLPPPANREALQQQVIDLRQGPLYTPADDTVVLPPPTRTAAERLLDGTL
jgi:hypothetical protein